MWSKLISKVVFFDFNNYQSIDLLDVKNLNMQRSNVEAYRVLSSKFHFWALLLIIEIAYFSILVELLELSRRNGVHIGFHVGFVFAAILFCLIAALKLKCPHCGSRPVGRSLEVGSDTGYLGGVHPFPSRCQSCGYYLSRRALENDLRKQSSNSPSN